MAHFSIEWSAASIQKTSKSGDIAVLGKHGSCMAIRSKVLSEENVERLDSRHLTVIA